MKNKILIELIVPNISVAFELFIPINERVDKIIEMILKGIREIEDQEISSNLQFVLMDAVSGNVYDNNIIVRKTGLKNGAKVLLINA